ncbi:hypothetical protein [Pseudoduganella aquatica]|uniref:Gel scht n=1 Tax=Pseudoduganella aquatica TaxID=2660641 RepID=A0A7X4KN54_9BURK|nr:hypothetical protein [Pseudoduganella aquatica]MYN08545.1 hypothetical protein [Pseudoduganella aquatica]
MRVYFGAAVCAALWLGMPGAYADPQADSVQIKAPQTMRLAPGEFDEYASSYLLSNGQRIAFSQRGQRYFVRLDGEPRMEILPRAQGVFTTFSGARMEFGDRGNAITIRNYERLVTSVALPADTVMMASR